MMASQVPAVTTGTFWCLEFHIVQKCFNLIDSCHHPLPPATKQLFVAQVWNQANWALSPSSPISSGGRGEVVGLWPGLPHPLLA